MNVTRVLLALALAALVGAGCTHTGINSPEGWNVVKSKHFNLYTSTNTLYEEPLRALEFQYAALSSSFFRGGDVGKIDVLFLEDTDFTELFGNRREGAALARVPGGGAIGKDGLVVVQPNQQLAGAEMVTHVFIHRAFPKAPLWFHEGFSAYARTAEYQEGAGQRRACFGRAVSSDFKAIPLAKVFAMGWDEYDGDEARGWFKHSARMLIDYTMHGENGRHANSLGAVVQGIAQGQASDALVAAAYPELPLAELDRRVAAHGTDVEAQTQTRAAVRGLCPVPFPVPPERAADLSEDRPLEPATAADIAAVLAGIRKLPRRDDGYPPWYPTEVVAQAEGGAGGGPGASGK